MVEGPYGSKRKPGIDRQATTLGAAKIDYSKPIDISPRLKPYIDKLANDIAMVNKLEEAERADDPGSV